MVLSRASNSVSAKTLLMIPDLFHYFLSGEVAVEYTNATTSQMYSSEAGDWARTLLDSLQIPTRILPRIVQPGTILGQVRPQIAVLPDFRRLFR